MEHNEEARIVGELDAGAGELRAVLFAVVEHVLEAERRLGATVFRDMLGLHFSSTRPVEEELAQHPLAEFLTGVIDRAQAGPGRPDRDAGELSMFS